MIFSTWEDGELITRCKEMGLNARLNFRAFAGMLPEVACRGLHRKHGCASIHEFAAKWAMMSHQNVERVLRLAKRFHDMPHLLTLLENGEAGWSKLEVVASRATRESEEFWARKVKEMTQKGLIIFVKEIRKKEEQGKIEACVKVDEVSHLSNFGLLVDESSRLGGDETIEMEKSQTATLATATGMTTAMGAATATLATADDEKAANIASLDGRTTLSFKVSTKTEQKLRLMKQRLERKRGETMTLGEVVEVLLKERSEASEKIVVREVCKNCVKNREKEREREGEVGRNISISVKRLVVTRQQGGVCAFPGCNRPGTIFHHTRRFALKKSHDPDYIVLLCEAHERVAQSNLIEHEESASKHWKIRKNAPWWDPKTKVDKKVATFRQERWE